MALGEFEKLNNLYSAIKQIDKIISTDNSGGKKSENKIEDLLIAVKDINTKEFNKEYVDQIILGFRNAILEIYSSEFSNLNKNLEVPGSVRVNDINNIPVTIKDNRSENNII